ncbi:MAG: hypothetical protein A2Z18_02630 [Armatimonadetes bacterium RBG_16_58_9]|nr:MAG: hypothetical protein A2Z18_02630 [Armatimonadetes bacterium RBG_16_58_9]
MELPAYFHITIWTDVPRGPQELFSHPGEVIWEYDSYDFAGQFAGWDYDPRANSCETCFRFDVYLPDKNWFFQEISPAGDAGIYWLSIEAVYAYSDVQHPWGWKTVQRDPQSPAPDCAVRIFDPLYPQSGMTYQSGEPISWPDAANGWDLAFNLTSRTTLHGYKWQQPPVPGMMVDQYIGWDEPSVYRSEQIVADDWLCLGPDPVTDIHWWGSYYGYNGVMPPVDAPPVFHIGVWTNVPEDPSHPGQMIWQWWVPRNQLYEKRVGFDTYLGHPSDTCFRYDFEIPRREWFYQMPGPITTIYWLSISAVYSWLPPQHPWGWKTREHMAWDDAVKIFDPTAPAVGDTYKSGRPIVDGSGKSMDTSFELTTRHFSEAYLKWQQPPKPYHAPAFNGWDELSVYGRKQIVADDWTCVSVRPVTDIHWWGSFLGWSSGHLPPRMPDGFHFTMWTDVPPDGAGYSHPGEVIWHAYCDHFTSEFVGWDIDPQSDRVPEACFKFECKLPREDWFLQKAGSNIYWLSIAAVYLDDVLQEHLWGWKTRPRKHSLAPDDAVRIFDPTAPWEGMNYVDGEPIFWPDREHSWDMAFVLTTVAAWPGSLSFEHNHRIPDHFWYPHAPSDPHNEMASLWVSADPTEDVAWNTITLQAYGSGNDAADIASIDVWIDNNDDGKVDSGDTLIGSGAYPFDDGAVTINLGWLPPPVTPVIIPAGGRISVLVSYTMSGLAGVAPGLDYWFEITNATGTGTVSGLPVPVYGLPLYSAVKVAGPPCVTIGKAKQLPVDSQVCLCGKVLTADFWNTLGLFYIEEQDRSAGIGVYMMPTEGDRQPANIGDHVSVLGRTMLIYGMTPDRGTELVIMPERILYAPGSPVSPVGTSNRSSGGGRFGSQPGVVDFAWTITPKPAFGLSTVGMLLRAWGRVTCYNPEIETPWGRQPVFWIDDGSALMDGFLCATDPAIVPTRGVAVLVRPDLPGPVPGGYWGITGILKAIPNPMGEPVRLLVPRDARDMTPYPEPE